MTVRAKLFLAAVACGTAVFLVYRFVGVGTGSFFLWGKQGRRVAPRTTADREARIASGRRLFAERCAQCHGSDARGGFCPDLTRRKFRYGRSRVDLSATISFGRADGRMPAFNRQLSPQQVDDLAEYILSL